eukprot:CAMPEP_0172872576 /NCGR_PEP_ID=MMETSP1075-20121228/92706_1 /TAXON_ID=2916 /ORGANISM="Ceratium fusus, Strain PA161109" /LENGTH=436 /DNA_ID=CAMNT_0013722909 /DNA_START=79 /DNA_END=1392 /DNA_ORIENTATION=+
MSVGECCFGSSEGQASKTAFFAASSNVLVEELRSACDLDFEQLLVFHGIKPCTGAQLSNSDLGALLERPLRQCAICLDDDGTSTTSLTCCEGHCTGNVTRCRACRRPFHRNCIAQHVVFAVERGQLPLRCPALSCEQLWPEHFLKWALNADQMSRYQNAVQAILDLRHAGHHVGDVLSPRSADTCAKLGFRACPRCKIFIQKQSEGLFTGCDKMTCRCGCMFCYKCGLEALAGGVARCRCVGPHHSFIPIKDVLSNYQRFGSFGGIDDLTKQTRGVPSKAALARLHRELLLVRTNTPPYIHVSCDTDLLSWNFLLEGPPGTLHFGGQYWGQLTILGDYPFLPPLIRIFTPNGRFKTNVWLCRSTLDYHPEGWQPSWTLVGLVAALLALMCEDSFTAEAVHPPPAAEDVRRLARESRAWNRRQLGFVNAFSCGGDAS